MAAVQRQRRGIFQFHIFPDSGDYYHLICSSRDTTEWETRFRRVLAQLDGKMTMQIFYEIAFSSATRQGLWDGTFNEFRAGHDIEPIDMTALGGEDADEDDGLDPTRMDR